jgi:hypothetical protein
VLARYWGGELTTYGWFVVLSVISLVLGAVLAFLT